MSGPAVLTFVYLAGILFVVLWMFAAMHSEGAWGVFLVFGSWMIAVGLAWTLVIPLAALINGWVSSEDSEFLPYFVYLGVAWFLVLLFFIPIRLATDKLSRVRVVYPTWYEVLAGKLGSIGLAGAICFLFLLEFPDSGAVLKLWWVAMGLP